MNLTAQNTTPSQPPLIEHATSGTDICQPSMPLLDLLNDFYHGRRTAAAMDEMRATVAAVGQWLGHEATLTDLTERNVRRFMAQLRGEGCERKVIDSRRRHLAALGKLAATLGRGKQAEKLGLLGFRFRPPSPSEPEPEGSLKTLVEEEYFKERDICREGQRCWGAHLRYTVRMFSKWLGRHATVADLTEATVSRFLLPMIHSGLNAETVLHRRGCLVAVAKFAESKNLLLDTAGAPRLLRLDRIVRAKRSRSTTATWTVDEVKRLITAAGQLPGTVPGSKLRRGLYWAALIAVMHDSGLNLANLRLLRRDQINSDGSFHVVEQKTGRTMPCMIYPETTLKLVDAASPHAREFIFENFVWASKKRQSSPCRGHGGDWFARIATAAGLKGTLCKLHKTSAALVDYTSSEMLLPMPPRLLTPAEVEAITGPTADCVTPEQPALPQSPAPPADGMTLEVHSPGVLTLHDLLQLHYIPAKLDLSTATVVWLTGALNLLGEFLERPAVLPDLSDRTVCLFMRWLLNNGRSARTTNSRRCGLFMLWRFAHRKGMVANLPQEVPKAKEPKKVPTSWSDEQFAQIITGCEQYTDAMTGKILKAVLLTAWDTDCRIGAILAAKKEDFNAAEASLLLFETKTRTQRSCSLSDETASAIAALNSPTPRLFGWRRACTQDLREHLTEVLKSVGLPASSRDKFHKIRRTKYTRVFLEHGLHAASEHAGHATDMSRHYLDSKLLMVGNMTKTIPPPQKVRPAAPTHLAAEQPQELPAHPGVMYAAVGPLVSALAEETHAAAEYAFM